ncbi:MAG: dephospho-CoA kinase [Gallionella sp.]
MKSGFLEVPFCIGLTGGIGCGKSTVAGLFAKLGAGIIDTDMIAHRLTQAEGPAISAIRSAFGNDYIDADGALDREKMRRLIFSDGDAKQRLEKLLHPLILEQAKTQSQQLHTRPYIIIVVPLLPESPAFQRLTQRILVVDCTEDAQLARVIARSRMPEPEVRAIIAQQTPRLKRLELADDVIHNDAGMENLSAQVNYLHESYLKSN